MNKEEKVYEESKTTVENKPVEELVAKNQRIRDDLANKIRIIKSEIEEKDSNEELTEELEGEADAKITDLATQILVIQKKINILQGLSKQQIDVNAAEEKATQGSLQYEPTAQEVGLRKDELVQNPNESGWTDATEQSQDGEGGDAQVWMLDDQEIDAMGGEESEESEEQEKQEKQVIDYEQLQEQFVTGGESHHQLLFGKHQKFCVSLNGISKSGLLFSGGGDDYLHLYNFPKEETSPETCLKPYHLIKHTETITKVELSYLKEHIFTMTHNEILCTDIKTLQTKPLKTKSKEQIEKQGEDGEPLCSDMVCHTQGDVVAVASGFQLQIFNIKGLKSYQSYYCEREINTIGFTDSGKQMFMTCDDNKIRLLTPKTSEFSTISGIHQHKAEISAIKCRGDIIISGCIEGYVGVSSIKMGSMVALIGSRETEELNGSINHLEFAGGYFISGSSLDSIDWFDLGKTKKLFNNPLEGSPTCIRWQGKSHEHTYNVSTIKGIIYVYDCRNPLKEVNKTVAGNTIHDLWAEEHNLVAGCEDGTVRVFDVRKLI